MCDYAVFLSRLEFSIVLMAGGVEELPCFILTEPEKTDQKDMTKAIHSLVIKGFVQIKATGLWLVPWLAKMIEVIKNSIEVLFMEPGDSSQPQRIVYLGQQAVVLENTTEINQEFRIMLKSSGDLWPWIEEVFDIPDVHSGSKDEALELIRLSKSAGAEIDQFRDVGYSENCSGIHCWMKKIKDEMGDQPLIGIRLIGSTDRSLGWDLIIVPGSMNLWFLYSDGHFLEIVPDSMELRKEMRKLFWRGEK